MNNNNNKNEDDDDFKVKVRVGGRTRGAMEDEFAAAARKSEHSFPPGKNDPLKRKKKNRCAKTVTNDMIRARAANTNTHTRAQ